MKLIFHVLQINSTAPKLFIENVHYFISLNIHHIEKCFLYIQILIRSVVCTMWRCFVQWVLSKKITKFPLSVKWGLYWAKKLS